MAYFKSDIIVRGWKGGTVSMVAIMAAISPIWFECWGPGIQIARIRSCSGPNHTPLLHQALSFPLLSQVPSVYRVISRWWRFVLLVLCRHAGMGEILSRSVNILKHSARLFLHVIVKANVAVCPPRFEVSSFPGWR